MFTTHSMLPLILIASAPFLPRVDAAVTREPGEKFNYMGYIPAIAPAIAAAVLYALLFGGLFIRWTKYRWNPIWWVLGGILAYVVGIVCRVPIHSNPYTLPLYILSSLLVLASPCCFIAFDYVLFGRLTRESGMDHHVLIRKSWIFVTSDCITFFMQISGSGLGASDSLAKVGSTVTLIGIIAQLVSFVIFTLVALHWGWKLKRHEPDFWSGRTGGDTAWKKLYFALLFTCIGFLVRSVFRSIELAQGYQGSLSVQEGYLYGLDSLPLFIALLVYVPFYPGMYLGPRAAHPFGVADHHLGSSSGHSMPLKSTGSPSSY